MNGSNTRSGRVLAWPGRHRLFVLIGLTYAYFFQGGDPNQASRYYLTRNLVERHAPDITPDHPLTIDKGEREGKFYSDKAPGVSLLAVAPYAAFRAAERITGLDPEDRGVERARLHAIVFLVSGLSGVFAAVFLRRVLVRFGTGDRAADLVTFGYALGTLAFPFSTVLFGHETAAAVMIAAFALCLEDAALPSPRPRRTRLVLGALWALAIVVEYPTALLVAVQGLYFVTAERAPRTAGRTFGWTLVGAVPIVAVHCTYAAWAFGSPFALPYRYVFDPIFRAHTASGLLGIGRPHLSVVREALFGSYRGLFFFCPFLVLAVAGFGAWIRSGERTRELVVCLATVALSFVMTAGYYAWDGGFSTGPRHLVPALPFLVVPIAWWVRRGRWAARVTAVVLVPSVAIMTACTAVLVQMPQGEPSTMNPLYTIIVPSLARGTVATNQLDVFHSTWHADASYNLGTLVGLSAWPSLILLAAVWGAAYARELLPRRATS
jgi:hypothetical protein